jgi:hypothetical protein
MERMYGMKTVHEVLRRTILEDAADLAEVYSTRGLHDDDCKCRACFVSRLSNSTLESLRVVHPVLGKICKHGDKFCPFVSWSWHLSENIAMKSYYCIALKQTITTHDSEHMFAFPLKYCPVWEGDK